MKAEREKSFSSFCVLWKTEWKNICFPDSGSKNVEFEKVEDRENKDRWKGRVFRNTTIPCIKNGQVCTAPSSGLYKKGCPQRRGRCPHRPAGCDARAVGKNAHACSVDTPGRCGYRPLHGIRREWAFNHRMFLRNCRNFTKSALPSSLLMCYTDRNKTVTVKPTGNGGKSFRKGMFP